ncbi:BolA family protein [Methylomagnum ishizawai]|uniref:BolA family protein n=1 Tax=Methylomagnum ishizawai TaxID=1760988 RepID=UPI001C32A0BB|nr:BolA family protein [Methylomagnum ishizawai]BBL75950.1 cell division protein BolA [Methylomagnum ishizawai]
MTDRVEKIRNTLEAGLAPVHLEIVDDSHAHAGHAGAASGGGHFSALIVSTAFEGKNPVQRHQLVYRTLGELLRADIHAFSMKALTPAEFQSP